MDRARLGQIDRSAADVYEEFFVPALFLEPARLVARAGQIRPGQLVLDVACGTGVFARQIAQESGPDCVIGIDRNEGIFLSRDAWRLQSAGRLASQRRCHLPTAFLTES